jgi:hypothetical protein
MDIFINWILWVLGVDANGTLLALVFDLPATNGPVVYTAR